MALTDKQIDDFFDPNYTDKWRESTFICDRCKQEKSQFMSAIMPARGGKNALVCFECYCDLRNEIEQCILGRKR